MSKERIPLSTLDYEDLSNFQPKEKGSTEKVDLATIKEVAEQSGFPSREHKAERVARQKRTQNLEQRSRRTVRQKRSPYQDQVTLKCRTSMRVLFRDLGERLDIQDIMTFEQALLALIEKHGCDDLLERYKDALNWKSS